MLDACPSGIARLENGKFSWANPAFLRQAGIDFRQLTEFPPGLLFASEAEAERTGDEVAATLNRGEAYGGECRLRREDGAFAHLRVYVRPLNSRRQGSTAAVFLEDVTERRARERDLRTMFESAPLGVVRTVGTSISDVNSYGARVFG